MSFGKGSHTDMEYGNLALLVDNTTGSQEPEIIQKMATLAARIAVYNFKWRYVVLLMFTTLHSIGIEHFMSVTDRPLYIKYGEFTPRHRVHVPHYVLFLENTAEINRLLRWLMKVGFDNTGRFIVVCASPSHQDCDEITIFKTCLQLIMNNIVLIRPSKDGMTPVAFSFWPIRPGKCGESEPINLHLNWTCSERSCFQNLYPEKLLNLQRCTMKVSTFEQHPFMYLSSNGPPTGRDGNILSLMIDALNATLEIVSPVQDSYGRYENGNWTGSIGDAFSGRAHCSMCAAPLTYNKYGNFQISITYDTFDLVWVTSMPASKPPWEQLLYPMKLSSRVLLFVVFIMIALTNSLLKTKAWSKVRLALDIARPKSNLLFYAWSLFLGNNIKVMPTKTELRVIVYMWVWFCFILRTLYQATLISSLKLKLYDDRFQSINDVIEAGRPYGGSLTVMEYYAEEPYVYKNWVPIALEDVRSVLAGMSDGTLNFVLAVSKATVLEYLMYHNGTKNLQILPQQILNSPMVIYFKKYQPLTYPTNRVLSHLKEGGFIDRPIAEYVPHGSYYFLHKDSDAPVALKLQHFTGSMGIIFAGWSISCLFFFLELICASFELKAAENLLSYKIKK